ncbi:hypothetical protein BH23ACT9_BH23ACT9_20570 [soil metagenome]
MQWFTRNGKRIGLAIVALLVFAMVASLLASA